MIDPPAAVQSWLKNDSGIAAIVGANVFIPSLPEGYSVAASGPAIVIRRRGGSRHPEIPPLIEPSVAIESWAETSLVARQVAGLVSDLIHGSTAVDLGALGFVITAQEEVSPQDMVDPSTHWPITFAYYSILMRAQVS